MTSTEFAQKLIDLGFMQTSRKHGHVGRVPPGKTAKEALFEAAMKLYLGSPNEAFWRGDIQRWVDLLGEAECAGYYARVHATGSDRRTVSPLVLQEFRRLGGKTA